MLWEGIRIDLLRSLLGFPWVGSGRKAAQLASLPSAPLLSDLFTLSQSQVEFIQLLSLIKHHDDAQRHEVVMTGMMTVVVVVVVVVVMIMMSGSPKPEDAYIWVCIKAMLDTREN